MDHKEFYLFYFIYISKRGQNWEI